MVEAETAVEVVSVEVSAAESAEVVSAAAESASHYTGTPAHLTP